MEEEEEEEGGCNEEKKLTVLCGTLWYGLIPVSLKYK